jgi:hypothetical protein
MARGFAGISKIRVLRKIISEILNKTPIDYAKYFCFFKNIFVFS